MQDPKTLTHQDQLHGLIRLNPLHIKATIPVATCKVGHPILRPFYWLSGSTHSDIASPPRLCVKLSEHDFVRICPRSGERSRALGRRVILGTDAMIAAILNLPACIPAACSSFSNPFRHSRKSATPLRHFRLAFSSAISSPSFRGADLGWFGPPGNVNEAYAPTLQGNTTVCMLLSLSRSDLVIFYSRVIQAELSTFPAEVRRAGPTPGLFDTFSYFGYPSPDCRRRRLPG